MPGPRLTQIRSTARRLAGEIFLVRGAGTGALVFWIIASTASIVAAIAIGFANDPLPDLQLVREWLSHWRRHGNPYPAFDSLDYPPSAFLVLAPLGLMSDMVATYSVIAVSIVSAGLAAWLLVRWCSERLAVRLSGLEQATYVLIVLAGGSLRGAIWRGQTTPLAFLFGVLALHWARSRPVLAAVALSICAFKPHIAIGFALALLLSGERRVLIGAAAMVMAQTAAFAASIGESLPDLLADYAYNLIALYAGPDRVRGLASIRWVLDEMVGFNVATGLYIALAALTLALIVSAARRREDLVTSVQVASACLLWSLLFLPHQLYNALLALPTVWLLMWPEGRVLSRERLRLVAVTVFVAFGVVDVPRLIRMVAKWVGDDTLHDQSYFLAPLRLAVLFSLLLAALTPSALRPPPRSLSADGS